MQSISNFLFVVFLATTTASADNKIGNGGNVIHCKNKRTGKTLLLDFYEESVTVKTSKTDAFEIATEQIQRLKNAAPKLAQTYLSRLQEMKSEIEYMNNVSLTPVPDSLHLFKPLSESCQVVQIAIRRHQTSGKEKRFIVRNDLWDDLPPLHRAGLLTHELIYEQFSKLGEKNSVKARKLNRYLYQDRINAEEFWKFIQELEVPVYP